MLLAPGMAILLLTAQPAPPQATLSSDLARVFPVPSGEAYAALERVLSRHGLGVKVRDADRGILRTSSHRLSKLSAGAPDPRRIVEGRTAVSFEVHAFLSRDVEPAHVHVDARVNLRSGEGHSFVVSRGPLEAWLLDELAAELGKEGRPMQVGTEGLAPECSPGELQPPEFIQASKVYPDYPVGARQRGDAGVVRLRTTILPDGSVFPDDLSVIGSAYAELKTAAVAAVRLWRYRPARNGTCPVPHVMTTAVSFHRGSPGPMH